MYCISIYTVYIFTTQAVESGSRRLVTALLQLGARLSADRHLGGVVSGAVERVNHGKIEVFLWDTHGNSYENAT